MNDRQKLHRSLGGLLHHQLASVIRDCIVSERYSVGQMLPPEMELCEQFSVSRITVRRAMESLVAEGLVERQRGRGTFVRASNLMAAMNLRSAMPDPKTSMGGVAALAKRTVTGFEFVPAPEVVRNALRLGPSARVLRVIRMGFAQNLPVLHTTLYLPERIGERFSPEDFASTPLTQLMARKKHAYSRFELHCTAMLADPAMANTFSVLIGAPMIKIKRIGYDKSGKPFDYLHGVAPPDRYEVKVSFEGRDGLIV